MDKKDILKGDNPFTHIDASGSAVMVDVGGKYATQRRAVAAGRIRMNAECFAAVQKGAVKKGDVLGVAQVAGIMGAKRTSELIPLCHTLSLTGCGVEFVMLPETCDVEARCAVKCDGKTGAEMEALTGVTTALLTVYDMCKAIDKRMEIHSVRLVEKSGGKSGDVRYEESAQ